MFWLLLLLFLQSWESTCFFFSRPERVAVFYVLLHLQQQPQKAGGFVNRDSQDNAPKSTHYRKAPNRCILYAIQQMKPRGGG
jgi:hypothetical protein